MNEIRAQQHAHGDAVHPFGGCNLLLKQYEMVGKALREYELCGGGSSADREFRIGVAFVPLEVLESYFEDLLDLSVGEDRLFLQRERRLHTVLPFLLSLMGLLGALAVGLLAVSSGASLFLSFGLTICLAVPFAVFWHFAPRQGASRRMRFAHIVSHEIMRRKGADNEKNTTPGLSTRFLWPDWFRHTPTGPLSGAARTATPHILH